MRTRATLSGIFASVGILLAGWQIGSAALQANQVAAPTTGTTNPGSSTGGSTTDGTTTSPSDGTWTGDAVNTRFGVVQVQVTISAGTITDVTALRLTDADGRSVQISNRAAPILRGEVLDSQSAHVSNVSGATYTARAYLSSLQSALDQAGF